MVENEDVIKLMFGPDIFQINDVKDVNSFIFLV